MSHTQPDRRLAIKEAARENEMLYHSVVDFSPNAIIIYCDNTIVYVNLAAMRLYGSVSSNDLVGKSIFDIVHSDFHEVIIVRQAVLKNNLPMPTAEIRCIRLDGETAEVEMQSIPILYLGVASILVTVRDITDHKKATKALMESEAKYRSLVETTQTGYLILDQYGLVVDANSEYVRLSGHSILEDILGRSVLAWTTEGAKKQNAEAIAQCLRHGFIRNFTTEYVDSNKKVTAIEINASIEKRRNGLYIVSLCRDITERKQAQAALINAERMSAIGEMSSGVAHDFNNALQLILGNLEMALFSGGISPEAIENIEIAKRSAGDAAARIRQLQRFTKKLNNTQYVSLDINHILDEAVEQSRPIWKNTAERGGLQISFQKVYEKIPSIDGDMGEINSVLHNLIKNAVEAMSRGGIITIETGVVNEKVFIRITDTGDGMDEETSKRIFQPFFSTKGLDAGRGLGLSSVYSVVHEHSGKISIIKTAPGEGTTFELLFPFGTKGREVLEKTSPSMDPVFGRILWVDDEEAIRSLGKRMLARLGHLVDIAASGNDALEILKSDQYDLLITDIGMPGMSGWQLAEAVKGKYPGMKIIVVTGWGTNVSQEQKDLYGVRYVLGKPTTMSDLERLIGKALRSEV